MGKYAFDLHQFRADFPGQSVTANKFALKRLVDKAQIIFNQKGYYLIIPPQYRAKGILPPSLFLDAIKKELDRPYYLAFVVEEPAKQNVHLKNMESKMQDDEFIGDIAALIRPTEKYDQATAFELVRTKLLEKIEDSKQ
jgi:hypothetical protein